MNYLELENHTNGSKDAVSLKPYVFKKYSSASLPRPMGFCLANIQNPVIDVEFFLGTGSNCFPLSVCPVIALIRLVSIKNNVNEPNESLRSAYRNRPSVRHANYSDIYLRYRFNLLFFNVRNQFP